MKRTFSDRTIIVESKNTTLDLDQYLDGLAHYFAKWMDDGHDTFWLFTHDLDTSADTWELIHDAEENLEKLEGLFQGLLDEGKQYFENPDQVFFEHFRDFLANTEVFDITYSDLVRFNERIEETGEYRDQAFLRDYRPIDKDEGQLILNLLQVTDIPDTVYTFEIKDGTSDGHFWDVCPHYYPIHPKNGILHSFIPLGEFENEVQSKLTDSQPVSFESWVDDVDSEENVVRALLRRILAFNAHVRDCGINMTTSGTLLFAHYDPSYGEKREYDNIWLAQPARQRSEYLHRAVWVEVRKFDSNFYFVFKPTKEFTEDGMEPVDSQTKDELTHKFAGRNWAKNRRTYRVVEAWNSLLSDPIQADFYGDALDVYSDEVQNTLISNLEIELLDDFRLGVRPPDNPREHHALIQNPHKHSAVSERHEGGIERYQ